MIFTALSYNTLFGGRDKGETSRGKVQVDVINSVRPDILTLQELKTFDQDGQSLVYALEQQIGMRGFLAIAPNTGQNTAVFISPALKPLKFETDGTHFHHALAHLTVELADGQPLSIFSAHFCPYGPDVRQREATYLTPYPAPGRYALLAGDFNSLSPHDPDPENFNDLSARDRARYITDYLGSPDRSILKRLERSGWVDVGHKLEGNSVPTVPTAGFKDTEFPTMRCDYIMASDKLAAYAMNYSVVRTPETDTASDHYPVTATFRLPE